MPSPITMLFPSCHSPLMMPRSAALSKAGQARPQLASLTWLWGLLGTLGLKRACALWWQLRHVERCCLGSNKCTKMHACPCCEPTCRYVKFDTYHPAAHNGLPVTRVICRHTLQVRPAGALWRVTLWL